VFAAGQSLREQARWLDENHDLVIGLFDKMEDRVIGAHGIHVEPQPLDLEGNLHSDFAGQLSALWAEWSVRPEVTGMFTRPEAERLLLRSALRDGEVFTQLVRETYPACSMPRRYRFLWKCWRRILCRSTLTAPPASRFARASS
jgi:capsid protein